MGLQILLCVIGAWSLLATGAAFVSQRRVRAGAVRERRLRSLLLRELDLAAIALETVVEAVFVCDENGNIVLANPAACAMLGRPAFEVCGRRIDDLVAARSSAVVQDPGALRDVAVSLKADPGTPQTRRILVRHSDGLEHHSLLRAAGLRGESGALVATVFILRDVTESEEFATFTTCARGIAHDVNNALCVMLGNLSIAKLRLDSRPGVSELLDEAENAALRVRTQADRLSRSARANRPQPTQ